MFQFDTIPPLSLYLHIPWCVRKCPYCDFNSHAADDALPEDRYVEAVLRDLEQELPLVWGRAVETVFIGGGTPSLFSPEAMDRLLSGIRARVTVPAFSEITMEANPGTFEQARFEEFRAMGINRLSVGVQSFSDDSLKRIGRIHDGAEARRAVEAARKAGFDNINLDLMFGLPGQDPAAAQRDVEKAIELEPEHISRYQLTIEPNTYFHTHTPPLPEEDHIWDMQEAGQALLAEHGYGQYEVSAYARDKRQCQHNLNYWRFGDYLGIGAGAHGKLTLPGEQRVLRRWKTRQPKAYMDQAGQPASVGERVLDPADAVIEFMMNALRLTEGFETRLFTEHTGLPIAVVRGPLAEAEERGLIEWSPVEIRPTERGMRYLNELLQLFMVDEKEIRQQLKPAGLKVVDLTGG